jgi:hypothetical protein
MFHPAGDIAVTKTSKWLHIHGTYVSAVQCHPSNTGGTTWRAKDQSVPLGTSTHTGFTMSSMNPAHRWRWSLKKSHFLLAWAGQVEVLWHLWLGWARTDSRETTCNCRSQISLLPPCAPSPVLCSATHRSNCSSLWLAACRFRPTIIRNGLLFLFSIYGESELLPMVTADIKLFQGLRFTYWPCDLQQA